MPDAEPTVWLGGLGVRFLLDGARTGGRFSVVEHPLLPHALGAPVHTHADEDEYSFVLEGEVGVQIGDQVLTAGPGAVVVKPRGIAHAFWNAGDVPARLLEVISPAGFERYFAELAPHVPPAVPAPDFAGIAAVRERYHLSSDPASVPALVQRYGLVMG
jgi:quercetin dioxygenase-like cupin family protein